MGTMCWNLDLGESLKTLLSTRESWCTPWQMSLWWVEIVAVKKSSIFSFKKDVFSVCSWEARFLAPFEFFKELYFFIFVVSQTSVRIYWMTWVNQCLFFWIPGFWGGSKVHTRLQESRPHGDCGISSSRHWGICAARRDIDLKHNRRKDLWLCGRA